MDWLVETVGVTGNWGNGRGSSDAEVEAIDSAGAAIGGVDDVIRVVASLLDSSALEGLRGLGVGAGCILTVFKFKLLILRNPFSAAAVCGVGIW